MRSWEAVLGRRRDDALSDNYDHQGQPRWRFRPRQFTRQGERTGPQTGGTQAAHVFHVRDGKIVKLGIYFDRDRGLADLGLAPQASAPDA
jgi:hypothetical protein